MSAFSRRHRAWNRRYGGPVMLIADRPSLVAALGRALFRYRSELAPCTTALGLLIFGAILHTRYGGAWPLVLAGTIGATVLAVWRGDRAEERAYAAVVVLVAGGWLCAATILGSGHDPLPTVLVVAMFALGVPWWTHRRRRARVRVDRVIRAWPDIADAIGLTGSRVMSAVVDVWGWRARMNLRAGQTVADVIAHVPAIESGLGTRPGAVRVEPDPAHAGRFVMRVLAADPHADAIRWNGPASRSIADPVELGVFEDATPVRVPLLRRHVLIGGTTDSGKSGVLNVILGNLAASPDVVLWGIDLKGGMELRPWAPCLARLATTPAEAAKLLHDAVKVLDARAHAMGEQANRVWEPSPQAPALVIVIDEYAELVDNAPGAVEHAESIARRGRAVCVTLLAANQRPTQKSMGGGALRSQMSVRICLRVRERRDVDLILDKGMLGAGWHAHTLDAPGKFYLLADGHQQPRRARGFLVTDNDVHTTVNRYAPERPALDELSTEAVHAEAPEVLEGEVVEPETLLWQALQNADDNGVTVRELMHHTGMRRTWIYDHLQEHANADRVEQVARGRWRAVA
jgi:S-DNA-T family DNA segregation ATPase FtsK/SpoIIIE